MRKLPVYILAGGRSSRFGSEKAFALLGGRPLIAHVVEAVRPWASAVTVVTGRAGSFDRIGLRTIPDLLPQRGPLGGLHAALVDSAGQHAEPHAKTDSAAHGIDAKTHLLLCACDQPGINPGLIEPLVAGTTSGALAAAYRENQRWQPLPGVYALALLPRVEAMLTEMPETPGSAIHDQHHGASGPSLSALLDQCHVPAVPLTDHAAMRDIDAPGDLARWEMRSRRNAP